MTRPDDLMERDPHRVPAVMHLPLSWRERLRRLALLPAILLSALFLALPGAIGTPVDTANFAESSFVQNNGLGSPTGLGWAPDGSGRLFVIRKGGEVRVVQYDPGTSTGTLVATPWTTISPVFTNFECGLIGFCFDPDFLNNRYVYFFVTVAGDSTALTGEQQIIRYTDDPLNNTGSNKTVLIAGLPCRGANHNGGAISIGPDGRLYWAIGDVGNNTGVDTDLVSFAAKVGRANRFTGATLNDNPFFDGAGQNNDYIWARGFRNPFTMMFQPGTGKLWLNVVGSSLDGQTQPLSGQGFEQIFAVRRGDHGGWNDYENNQPPGFLAPLIAYRVNNSSTVSLGAAGAARSGNVVTFTTQSVHPFRQGAKVTIAGVANSTFNGSFYVASRLSNTQFTVLQTGADATSGGGTASTLHLGGSVTGGCFYDSTAFPAAYRGNFFFGDVNTGNIARATLDPNDVPTSVDLFATQVNQAVDAAVGPDGALYLARHDGSGPIRRIATTSTAQNLVVHPTALSVAEGSAAVFTVRLAQAPPENTTINVNATKTGGDADLNIAAGQALIFNSTNWNLTQTVTLSAAHDPDLQNGSATFEVSAPGIATYTVAAVEIDDEEPQLVLSTNNLAFAEGGSGNFTVRLASAPATDVTVNVARSAGDGDINVTSGATLVFTPANFATAQPVTISAAEDADNSADAADISVTLAGDPTRVVKVAVTDNDNAAPVFVSTPKTTAIVNAPYRYEAMATGNPPPGYNFTAAPMGMTLNNTTGVVTWTPTSTGSFNVTVRASNAAGNVSQPFTLIVSSDAPPVAMLTQPIADSVLAGNTGEFFGDGIDDVGCVKGEFLVDGALIYTDLNAEAHYHAGGSHALFDTTAYANGPHTLRLRVTDTIGQTAFTEVQVMIGNGIDAWRADAFTTAEASDPSISGPLADPDHDGIPNALEYALNLAPKNPSAAGLPSGGVQTVAGADYLSLTFNRVTWATDVTYIVDVADSVSGPWTPLDPLLPANQVSMVENGGGPGVHTITVKDVVPVGNNPRFMRLRVTLP